MFNFSLPPATYLLRLVIKIGDSQSGLLESGPFPATEALNSDLIMWKNVRKISLLSDMLSKSHLEQNCPGSPIWHDVKATRFKNQVV